MIREVAARSIKKSPANSPTDMKAMGNQSVVATLWIRAKPERTTAKKQAAFSQKRSGSESVEEFSGLPALLADPPERRRLRYENNRTKAIKTMVCGK